MHNDFKTDYIGKIYLFVTLVIISLILGYIGFSYIRPDYHPLTKVYLSLQLFTLESGSVDKPEIMDMKIQVEPGDSGNQSNRYELGEEKKFEENSLGYISYNLARYLAALLVFWAAGEAFWALLRKSLFKAQLQRLKNHTIIFGIGNIGSNLAEDFLSGTEKYPGKLVIVEKDKSNEKISHFHSKKARIVIANALDEEYLLRLRADRAKNIIITTGNDIDNFHTLQQINNLYKTNKINKIQGQKTKITVHIEDPKLKEVLSVHEILKIRNAHVFNTNENGARLLAKIFPPDLFRTIKSQDDPTVKILLVGMGNWGYALLRQFIKTCHFVNGKKTKIHVLEQNITALEEYLENLRAGLNEVIDVNIIKMNLQKFCDDLGNQQNKIVNYDAIYICEENETDQVLAVFEIRKCFGRNIPIVLAKNNKTPIPGIVQEEIYEFEAFKDSCTCEIVMNEALDKTAEKIHNEWYMLETKKRKEKEERGEQLKPPKLSYKLWEELTEEYRDENRSVVDHLDFKLRALGFDPNIIKENEVLQIEEKLKNEKIVNLLAETEHRRWMAVKMLNGWKRGERNDEKKTHPDLIPYTELNQGTKDYDIEQIRKLPEFLRQTLHT